MEEILFVTPYPPSVNRIYVVSRSKRVSEAGYEYSPRVLTKEARAFKKYVSELLYYTFPKVKYGDHLVEIEIMAHPPDDNRTRDDHNCEKILYDAIEKSGIINNDKQIVKKTMTRGPKIKEGLFSIKMRPFLN